MAPTQPDIVLYTSSTPNGQKLSMTLEELEIPYRVENIQIGKNVQKEDWFLKINPNGRIPALVDRTSGSDGKPREKRIFEGAAMMLYLCERYDKEHKLSFPYDSDVYWEVMEWLVWMQSGLGPMQGQANYFFRYAPEKIDYAIKRYQTETKRLYQVLEDRLAEQSKAGSKGPWLVGDKMTIADLACFSWVNWDVWAGVKVKAFKLLSHWADRINDRPAIPKGLDVSEPFEMKSKWQTKVRHP
ncbi:hypothetical protein N7G274_003215 [Stereocaulon virgatum]|uniref:Glutathione S-transferase n=1 Tax=Stereocaulon virgatum TaxID=373712 RepID=A0ABR4AFG9_9LECA